jgi:ribosomal protein S18 acetylase RimI-like enzyme
VTNAPASVPFQRKKPRTRIATIICPKIRNPFLKLASRLDYYVGSLVRDKRPMPVRALRPSDLPVANELLRQLGYDIEGAELASRIERVLANAAHFAAVAEHKNAVCGLVHAYERPALEKAHEVVVQSLVVDQRARKEGVGKLLMDAAEMWASTKGARKVVLHTRVDRDDARSFYERLGYRRNSTSHLMTKSIDRRYSD